MTVDAASGFSVSPDGGSPASIADSSALTAASGSSAGPGEASGDAGSKVANGSSGIKPVAAGEAETAG
jgi:hypothetical protein